MSDSPRRRARELVLQALYASVSNDAPVGEQFQDFLEDEELSAKNLKFAEEFYALVKSKQEWADEQIKQLAHNWNIDRIAEIDLIILRMALTEMHDMPDTPIRVAMNEAIELAKKFSTAESSSFINGILDGFVKGQELLGKE
ncbi:MAG: transcription antitermination factor NusB [Candidatus Zixiibacteriota bacterium]|jgi:transcription antitermination protein NusB